MECVEFEASLEKLGGARVPVKKLQVATTYSTKSQNRLHMCTMGFPGNVGDPGSIPGLGRYPGEVNGNPLQYSGLENPMDRGAREAIVHGVT